MSRSIAPAFSKFTVLTTEDGSPTARFDDGESMHSLRGAFGETVYVYGTAIKRSMVFFENQIYGPRIFSMGLGLGYVEIVAAALNWDRNLKVRGQSFEIIPELTASFRAWLNGEPEQLVPHVVYDDVLERTRGLELSKVFDAAAIKLWLKDAVAQGDWILSGEVKADTAWDQTFHCIAFDAFSAKTSPDLWTREFLDRFLRQACSTPCVLATYACTGHLKRALKDGGFHIDIRQGYASKRDSTLAVRLSESPE